MAWIGMTAAEDKEDSEGKEDNLEDNRDITNNKFTWPSSSIIETAAGYMGMASRSTTVVIGITTTQKQTIITW